MSLSCWLLKLRLQQMSKCWGIFLAGLHKTLEGRCVHTTQKILCNMRLAIDIEETVKNERNFRDLRNRYRGTNLKFRGGDGVVPRGSKKGLKDCDPG